MDGETYSPPTPPSDSTSGFATLLGSTPTLPPWSPITQTDSTEATGFPELQILQVPSNTETIIYLTVGGRQFSTTRETLMRETCSIASLLFESWRLLDDGSFFIEGNPIVFESILEYLRYGKFPIFFDLVKGHDEPLYTSTLAAAKEFHIDSLSNWLTGEEYKMAAMVEKWTEDYPGDVGMQIPSDEHWEFEPYEQVKKVRVCAQRLSEHRGHPELCIAHGCYSQIEDKTFIYEEVQTQRVRVTRRKAVIDFSKIFKGDPIFFDLFGNAGMLGQGSIADCAVSPSLLLKDY